MTRPVALITALVTTAAALTAGVPQVVIDFPEYRALNELHDVADLVPDLEPATLALALNRLLPGGDAARYHQLAENCRRARLELNWQQEATRLLALYAVLTGSQPTAGATDC